jgi:hypothetical protein
MVIDIGPHHPHDGQTVRLAAILPAIGAQTGDHPTPGDHGGRVPTPPSGQGITYIGSMAIGIVWSPLRQPPERYCCTNAMAVAPPPIAEAQRLSDP